MTSEADLAHHMRDNKPQLSCSMGCFEQYKQQITMQQVPEAK